MSNTLKDRLELLLKERGRSARDVSLAIGQSPDTLRNILRGATLNPKANVLDAIAAELGTTAEYLLHGTGPAPIEQAQIVSRDLRIARKEPPPAMFEMPRDVPVYGTAAGSLARGAYQLFDGVVDYVRRPPSLATARDVYALFVQGESMEPQFSPGDLIFVHPNRPPRTGDPVVVQMQVAKHEPIEATIGILHARTSDTLVLGKHNPKADLKIKREYVLHIHKVISNNELYGI